MAEEFPDYDSFFVYPRDHRNLRPENVTSKPPTVRETTLATSSIQSTQPPRPSPLQSSSIYDPRQIETEKLFQKSLPNLKPSYGSIYPPSKSYQSESEPLLSHGFYHSDYLYGEAIGEEESPYRRSQVFLFFYIVFYVGYLIIGSICFQKLEVGVEKSIRLEFQEVRRKFLADNPSVKG